MAALDRRIVKWQHTKTCVAEVLHTIIYFVTFSVRVMFHWVITQAKEMCMLSSKLDIFGIPFFLHENANRQWACSCALLGEIKGICWKIMDTYFQLANPLMAWVGLKIFCLQNMMGCEQAITGKLTSTFFLMWQILQEIRSWTNMLYLKLGEMVNMMAEAEQLFIFTVLYL